MSPRHDQTTRRVCRWMCAPHLPRSRSTGWFNVVSCRPVDRRVVLTWPAPTSAAFPAFGPVVPTSCGFPPGFRGRRELGDSAPFSRPRAKTSRTTARRIPHSPPRRWTVNLRPAVLSSVILQGRSNIVVPTIGHMLSRSVDPQIAFIQGGMSRTKVAQRRLTGGFAPNGQESAGWPVADHGDAADRDSHEQPQRYRQALP